MRRANQMKIVNFQRSWNSLNLSQDEKSKNMVLVENTEIFEERRQMAFLLLLRATFMQLLLRPTFMQNRVGRI